jgi:LmbE family N-acetylglucosaminyl deacetylase
MEQTNSKQIAVIVAHPDDETLWAGGTILSQPAWQPLIISLCRGSDPERAPKFFRAIQNLRAQGAMGDLDDGPEQNPLAREDIQEAILKLLPRRHFDLLISHSPVGEYTRHRRHEEIGEAVIRLWQRGKVSTRELWLFAYEDGGKQYLPRPIKSASLCQSLPEDIWRKKYDIITELYGFPRDGFEAQTTPRAEAFWQFTNPIDAQHWLENKLFQHESSDPV